MLLKLSDEDVLLEACLKKDRKAQEILYNKYFSQMITICLRYLKNDDDASEVLNNAFLKIFENLNQYNAEGSFQGWVKRIVINSSIDFIRRNKNYKKTFIRKNEFSFIETPDDIYEGPNEMPDQALNLSVEEIFELVKELPSATRVVFNLFVIDEFSHRQISEFLKISEGTSKWHLSNARKLLKEKINQPL